MAFNEQLKGVIGRKSNIVTLLGILLMLFVFFDGGDFFFFIGLAAFVTGLWLYNRYKKKYSKKKTGFSKVYNVIRIILIVLIVILAFAAIAEIILPPASTVVPDEGCDAKAPYMCDSQCFYCNEGNEMNKLCCLARNDNWCCPKEQECDYGTKGCKGVGINDSIVADIEKSIVWVKYEVTGKDEYGEAVEGSFSGSGVIYSNANSKLMIFTNRHVVDCLFTGECFQKTTEKVSVRTQDGKIYPVSKLYFAGHNLDIAVLEVGVKDSSKYPVPDARDDITIGDKVVAIGYPSYAERVVEFSRAEGRITSLKSLLMDDGYAFSSIESDAYTYFGSSGGGLFDSNGNLVGVNTWMGVDSQQSIAIKVGSINDISLFVKCDSGQYLDMKGRCVQYCTSNEVLGKDGNCYGKCGFYCLSTVPNAHDSRCNYNEITGQDKECHKPCGSASLYCGDPSEICYKDRCVSCTSVNTYLYEDGSCRA